MKSKIQNLLLLCAIAFPSLAFAQNPTIKLIAGDKLSVNDVMIQGKIKPEALEKTLGQPTQKLTSRSGEVSYRYDELGVVFFVQENMVAGFGINFNWDGDKNYPEKSFTGVFKAGDKEITKDSKQADFTAIKVTEMVCPFPLMCASKDRTSPVKTTAAFKDEKVTQVVFLLE
jgi:hypothetical protein